MIPDILAVSVYFTVSRMAKVHIFTDGSCLGNPGPGGWAVIILVDNEMKDMFSGSEKHTTNNQMELLAPIKAIQKFKKKSEI